MLNKLFKRDTSAAKPTPPAAPQNPPKVVDKDLWTARLQASLGDDAALLALAKEAPLVDIKQSAVSALQGEESLKQAEREFRTQNQRVHRVAKQRYQAAVTQRESRERADQLIASATALANESVLPANRLVELDQAWQALDAGLLNEAQKSTYATLSAQLGAQLRERGEQRVAAQRWTAQCKEALRAVQTICDAVEAGAKSLDEVAPAAAELQQAWAAKPLPSAGREDVADLGEKVQAALTRAATLPERLAALEEARRHAAAQAAKAAESAAAAEVKKAKKEVAKKEGAKKVDANAVAGLVEAAEQALAGGHLAEARGQLAAIDQALSAGTAQPALQARVDAVQAEFARLKGWQHWGGGRAREDLVEEAEALARKVAPEVEGDGEESVKRAAKLNLKEHAQAIEQLRERWKELDRLGGAGGKALWPRFDAALKAAYVPVGEVQAKLKAARQDNLKARQLLLAELDALPLPAADADVAQWRETARALEHFESEWRKLGPVEHTVPHKSRDALLEQRKASLARLETPLREARRTAQNQRQALVERAKALHGEARSRDVVAKVRELQAEWQQHAKALPLPRSVENALWSEFKAATDAIFKQREAEASARDADFKAHLAAREGLIARLRGIAPTTPASEIARSVADIEREWRAAGEVARHDAARIDDQFRAAKAAALQLAADQKQRAMQTAWDVLLARLVLCEAAEAGGEASEPAAPAASAACELEARWAQAGGAGPGGVTVPAPCEQAVAARFQAALARLAGSLAAPAAPAAGDLDLVLLRLEAALDLPSLPEFQAARRDLKLRAMKEALEGRRQGAGGAEVETLLAQALATVPGHPLQAQRLRAVLAALRERPAQAGKA